MENIQPWDTSGQTPSEYHPKLFPFRSKSASRGSPLKRFPKSYDLHVALQPLRPWNSTGQIRAVPFGISEEFANQIDRWEDFDVPYVQLDRIKESASSEGYPVPSASMIEDARLVLNWMMRHTRFEYDVDPDEYGRIIILAMHKRIYVSVILSSRWPRQVLRGYG